MPRMTSSSSPPSNQTPPHFGHTSRTTPSCSLRLIGVETDPGSNLSEHLRFGDVLCFDEIGTVDRVHELFKLPLLLHPLTELLGSTAVVGVGPITEG